MSISTSSDGGATWHDAWERTFVTGRYSISETIATPDMGQNNVMFCIKMLSWEYIVFLDDIVMVGKPYGEWQDLHVTDTAVTLTGLNPNTVYDVKVVPDCNENKESEIVTFTTANPCETPTNLTVGNLTATTAELSWYGYSLTGYEVEYYTTAIIDEVLNEGFEGGTLPEGWTIEGDNQDPATTWRIGNGVSGRAPHSGNYNALITHNQDTDETFLVTPPLNLGAYDALELSFWYINRNQTYSTNVFDFLSVYYRIGEEGEWNELWSTGFNRHPDWTHQTLTLTGLADNCQIGFMMYDRNGRGVGLDDIVITNFVAPAGEPMTLTVEEGTSATLTGLAANTTYEVRVKSNCDAAEYCSPVVFTTSCNPITITAETPYTQDFESPEGSAYWIAGPLPPCWEGYSTGNVAPHNDNTFIINGSQSLSFYFGDNYAILPEFSNPMNELQISFMFRTRTLSGYSNHYGQFSLGYITADDDGTCNTFTEIITSEFDYDSSVVDPEPWNMDLSGVPADAHRLVFKWYDGQGIACYIDDVEVSLSSCLQPYTITAETPYTQDFESPAGSPYWKVGYLPPCWEGYSTGNVAPHNSDYYMIINGSQSLSFYFEDNYAILPEFSNPINELQISFMLHAGSPSGYSNHVGIFTLGYITADDDGTCNTFTEIITSEYDYYSSFQDPEPWNMDFSDVPADAHRLAFKWYGHGMLCNVDDLEVSATVSPIVTQTVALSAGWNWISSYVEGDNLLEQLKNGLGSNGIEIWSNSNSTEYDEEWGWFGDLDDIGMTNEEMYMVKTKTSCSMQLQGLPANPANYAITINPGWNWIGFPCNGETTLEEALSNFEAEQGDQIWSSSFSTEYDDGWGWFGDIDTLVPGEGYMYYSNSTQPKTLIFQTGSKAK